MRFRRPQVRYSDTPEPVTPYQAAAQSFSDDQDHSTFGQARLQLCQLARPCAKCAG